jgi:Photoprotection regulator fluorescence recovery protein
MDEFKKMADAVTEASEMWQIEDYLRRQRREIDEIFDYRYSELLFVFARLIHDGHLDESRLAGLSEEKREAIRSLLSYRKAQ